MTSKKTMEQFEKSKNEFIQSVCKSYEKFLEQNGVDIIGEIRTKAINEYLDRKESDRVYHLSKESEMLCELENTFVDKVQEFYGDLVDVEIISEWYFRNGNVTIELMWDDKTLHITNYYGQLKISGGKKMLRKYIKSHKELIKEFMYVSNKYYSLNLG
jgi:hypothetical protein